MPLPENINMCKEYIEHTGAWWQCKDCKEKCSHANNAASQEAERPYIVHEKTARGFSSGTFIDLYGAGCSVQKSSAAMYDAIWLGVDDAKPQVMASHVKDLPDEVQEQIADNIGEHDGTGWVPYPVPDNVLLTTRMHLNQKQVAELIPILQKFVDTGEI